MRRACGIKKEKTKNIFPSGEVRSGRHKGYELRGKLWIEGKNGAFLGYGRVILLEKIKELRSISRAARAMNMSYKHAWELVRSLNRQAKTPLVTTTTGGKEGGGARVTPEGEKAINLFWRLYRKFEDFLKREIKKIDV